MANKPLIYWDSCIFIAWLQDESQAPEILEGINDIAGAVEQHAVTLMTSVLTLTEVLQSTLTPIAQARFDEVFKRPNVQRVDVNQRVARLAHDIRNYYEQRRGTKVWGPDATHLATAILYDCDEFHTLDGHRRNKKQVSRLLALDGDVAGYPLRICVPPASPQLKLFPGAGS